MCKLLREGAILPRRATNGSAGYDLHACIDNPLTIPSRGRVSIPTGIAIALPSQNVAAFIFGRSGLGIKHGIRLSNSVAVIDSDYRGELMVGLTNDSDEDYTIQPGERIAQILILPIFTPNLIECNELPETARGAGGFGSTGKM